MTEDRFRQLIGGIIHVCGVLEFLTNDSIKRLGEDSLLSNEIITLPFQRRIRILRDLLHDRSTWSPETVDSLCNELSEIAKLRNEVAHNPIGTDVDDKNAKPFISVIRHKGDTFEHVQISEAQIQLLANRVHEALQRWLRLFGGESSSS
jgi:hypothetical protein